MRARTLEGDQLRFSHQGMPKFDQAQDYPSTTGPNSENISFSD